jgi:hypothetical protein
VFSISVRAARRRQRRQTVLVLGLSQPMLITGNSPNGQTETLKKRESFSTC